MSSQLAGEIEDVIDIAFPVKDDDGEPMYREYQKAAIEHTVDGVGDPGTDVVILNAPTGSGKSIILYTAMKASDGNSFFTTPLNSLVDQIDNDEFLDDVVTIKGRNNYDCIHPDDSGTPVDEAICQRDSDFDCEMKGDCEYYGRKLRAINSEVAGTNMSYIMAEGMIGASGEWFFDDRRKIAVDECQNLEDFAMNFISVTVSSRTVPQNVWDYIDIPPRDRKNDMEYLAEWLEEDVLDAVNAALDDLRDTLVKSSEQAKEEEKLRNFRMKIKNFLDDYEKNHWVADIDTDIRKNRPNTRKIVFKPIEIGRFLDNLIWDRGNTVILSSATVPGGGWLNEIGLGGTKVKRISMPSTFPVENRPIIMKHAVGKMTKSKREQNFLPMIKKIKALSEHHDGEKGFIHCRSYNIAKALKRSANNNGMGDWFRENCMVQDRYDREESLERWVNNDTQVFFSVAMDEGVDLDGDKCRWQCLAKVLYKSMGDRRVKFRVTARYECERCNEYTIRWEDGDPDECEHCGNDRLNTDWEWYNRHAAVQIQQAYGRAVRGPEDEAIFYVLDESAKGLIQRSAEQFNEWFLEAIDDMRIDPSRGVS